MHFWWELPAPKWILFGKLNRHVILQVQYAKVAIVFSLMMGNFGSFRAHNNCLNIQEKNNMHSWVNELECALSLIIIIMPKYCPWMEPKVSPKFKWYSKISWMFWLLFSAESFSYFIWADWAARAGWSCWLFYHKHSATWYFKVRNVFTLAEKKVHKRKLEDYGQNMVYLFSDRKMLQKGVGIAHLRASPPPFDRRKKPMNFCQATMWIQIVFVAWKSCDVYCSLWGHRGSYVYQHY